MKKKTGIYYIVWFAIYIVICYVVSLFGINFDIFTILRIWSICAIIEFIVDHGNFD